MNVVIVVAEAVQLHGGLVQQQSVADKFAFAMRAEVVPLTDISSAVLAGLMLVKTV